MTLQAALARPLMALAAALTPASRAEWSLAMRQEFEALQDGPGSLAWASGCLASSLGWRMRAEAPFGVGFMVAVLAGSWLLFPLAFNLMYPFVAPDWVGPVSTANAALQALASLVLALAWPRRAILAGLLVPFLWQDGAMPRFFLILLKPVLSNPWIRPSNDPDILSVVYALQFLFDGMWPCIVGAALGWGIRRVWPTRRTAVA